MSRPRARENAISNASRPEGAHRRARRRDARSGIRRTRSGPAMSSRQSASRARDGGHLFGHLAPRVRSPGATHLSGRAHRARWLRAGHRSGPFISLAPTSRGPRKRATGRSSSSTRRRRASTTSTMDATSERATGPRRSRAPVPRRGLGVARDVQVSSRVRPARATSPLGTSDAARHRRGAERDARRRSTRARARGLSDGAGRIGPARRTRVTFRRRRGNHMPGIRHRRRFRSIIADRLAREGLRVLRTTQVGIDSAAFGRLVEYHLRRGRRRAGVDRHEARPPHRPQEERSCARATSRRSGSTASSKSSRGGAVRQSSRSRAEREYSSAQDASGQLPEPRAYWPNT